MDPLIPKFIVTVLFLLVHGLASYYRWYEKRPAIDMITHFLGGLFLGVWIKVWLVAFALIIGWEFLEMCLVTKYWKAFRETPINKVFDVLFGLLGYFIAVDML
jgi:hypothetical protein